MGAPSLNSILDVLKSAIGVDLAMCVWDKVSMLSLVPLLPMVLVDGGASLMGYLGPILLECGADKTLVAAALSGALGGGGGAAGKPKQCSWKKGGRVYWSPICVALAQAGWSTKYTGFMSNTYVVIATAPSGWEIEWQIRMAPGETPASQPGIWFVAEGQGPAAREVGLPSRLNARPTTYADTAIAEVIAAVKAAPSFDQALAKLKTKSPPLPPGVTKHRVLGLTICRSKATGELVDCKTGQPKQPATPARTTPAAGLKPWHIAAGVAGVALGGGLIYMAARR